MPGFSGTRYFGVAIRLARRISGATFPVSVFLVRRGGMMVICAGTTGWNQTQDARYLCMHLKRVQGSHFANLKPASAACQLMLDP